MLLRTQQKNFLQKSVLEELAFDIPIRTGEFFKIKDQLIRKKTLLIISKLLMFLPTGDQYIFDLPCDGNEMLCVL